MIEELAKAECELTWGRVSVDEFTRNVQAESWARTRLYKLEAGCSVQLCEMQYVGLVNRSVTVISGSVEAYCGGLRRHDLR